MKSRALALTAFALLSCSAEKQEQASPLSAPVARPASFRLFERTELRLEADLLQAASVLLRRGTGLGAPLAERCWRNEAPRPLVREACLLLWASGGEESNLLGTALSSGATESRTLAAAAILRVSPVEKLPAERLLGLLELLKQDPLWMRAQAVEFWSRANGSPERFLLERMVPHLLPPENGPAKDTAAALRALYFLSPGHWQAVLGQYCNIAVKGLARSRCWRLVGALADPSLPAPLAAELKAFLPARSDRDWALFTRHFPSLAARILKLFSLEPR